MRCSRGLCAGLAVIGLVVSAGLPARSEPRIKFPVVFTSLDELAELGISYDPDPYDWETKEKKARPRFSNTCYDFGLEAQGPSFISLSDAFLAPYLKAGYTRESVCMGLVSGARFDPETGRRLPTFVYKNEEVFKKEVAALDIGTIDVSFYVPSTFKTKAALARAIVALKRGDATPLSEDQLASLISGDAVYPELPLVVPECFKNATPYLDCDWRYGLVSGKKFTSATRRRYARFGERLDRRFNSEISDKVRIENSDRADPYLTQDGLFGGDEDFKGLGLSYIEAPVTFYDISPAFPHGYGHALYTTGEKDAAISAASVLAAFDGTRSASRFGSDRLRRLLK